MVAARISDAAATETVCETKPKRKKKKASVFGTKPRRVMGVLTPEAAPMARGRVFCFHPSVVQGHNQVNVHGITGKGEKLWGF